MAMVVFLISIELEEGKVVVETSGLSRPYSEVFFVVQEAWLGWACLLQD